MLKGTPNWKLWLQILAQSLNSYDLGKLLNFVVPQSPQL